MKLLAILAAAILIASCGSSGSSGGSTPGEPSSVWQAGPVFGGRDYSPGTVLEPQPGDLVAFNIPADPGSVHYVTKAASLVGATAIRMRYRLDGGPVIGAGCAPAQSAVTVYFQRSGDDWSGTGDKETYRWWATFATSPLTPGEHEIDAPISGKWTAIETSDAISSPAKFADAVQHSQRVGFTFANCTGYGHGATATGPARFTVLEFTIAH